MPQLLVYCQDAINLYTARSRDVLEFIKHWDQTIDESFYDAAESSFQRPIM